MQYYNMIHADFILFFNLRWYKIVIFFHLYIFFTEPASILMLNRWTSLYTV
jgi:hypothetical protein